MQLMSGTPWETVTLTTLSRDRNLFPELLTEARDLAMRGQEGKLVIHTAWGIEWRPFGQPRLKRPVGSVVLAPGVAENIENDIKSFLDRRQWYADRGLYSSNHLLPQLFTIRFRYTLSSRLFTTWSTRIRKNVLHSSTGWSSFIRHMRPEPI
jgi:hypothetical protein